MSIQIVKFKRPVLFFILLPNCYATIFYGFSFSAFDKIAKNDIPCTCSFIRFSIELNSILVPNLDYIDFDNECAFLRSLFPFL